MLRSRFAIFTMIFSFLVPMGQNGPPEPLALASTPVHAAHDIDLTTGNWNPLPLREKKTFPHWPTAVKEALGTTYEEDGATSPVWFTVAQGAISEIYYPRNNQTQVGGIEIGLSDTSPLPPLTETRYLNEGLTIRISGKDPEGRYRFEQEVVADSSSPTVRIQIRFFALTRPFQAKTRAFVRLSPMINNSDLANLGFSDPLGLYATAQGPFQENRPVHLALLSSTRWQKTSVIGARKEPGKVLLFGEVEAPEGEREFSLDLALSFGSTREEATTYAKFSLEVPFDRVRERYESSWQRYLRQLEKNPAGSRIFLLNPFMRRSAQILKMHEDKITRGAIVSSLSHPVHSPERAFPAPKDLYYSALALLAAGDPQTPLQVLRYFAMTQRKDGSWPRWLKPYGQSENEETFAEDAAFPILLAQQLKVKTGHRLTAAETQMIQRATGYLLAQRPGDSLDSWGEYRGFTPSSLATVIAGLRSAIKLTGELELESRTQEWVTSIETWTLVPSGPLGKSYYLRVSPHGHPRIPELLERTENRIPVLASELLDGGFLNLVRLGVRDPNDPRILSTLRLYDNPRLGLASSGASDWGGKIYQHSSRDRNHPNSLLVGYWPVLAGERGHYAIAAQRWDEARLQLAMLEQSATAQGHIPQVLSAPPSSTLRIQKKVACPSIRAHAEDILLHRSLEEGTVFDTPDYPTNRR